MSERFDAEAEARKYESWSADTDCPHECQAPFDCTACTVEKVAEILRTAYQRGWKDAPENDRRQVEALLAEVERLNTEREHYREQYVRTVGQREQLREMLRRRQAEYPHADYCAGNHPAYVECDCDATLKAAEDIARILTGPQREPTATLRNALAEHEQREAGGGKCLPCTIDIANEGYHEHGKWCGCACHGTGSKKRGVMSAKGEERKP